MWNWEGYKFKIGDKVLYSKQYRGVVTGLIAVKTTSDTERHYRVTLLSMAEGGDLNVTLPATYLREDSLEAV